mmetsp:Transcript_12531/g.14333  ORF Transcript_12531/g.14333 Transcript_12531/m.14333 type:complete len:131 (-) Transcript_12531:92-484(-)
MISLALDRSSSRDKTATAPSPPPRAIGMDDLDDPSSASAEANSSVSPIRRWVSVEVGRSRVEGTAFLGRTNPFVETTTEETTKSGSDQRAWMAILFVFIFTVRPVYPNSINQSRRNTIGCIMIVCVSRYL